MEREPQRLAIASDHAGFALKQALKHAAQEWGFDVQDFGVNSTESVDYPDYAALVADAVAGGQAALGVLVCGSGIGMSIAANKVAGVRAALCSEPYSAEMARAHNDANVLCVGQRVVGVDIAVAVLRAFLGASFVGDRHQRRIEKMQALERRTMQQR